VFLWRCCPWPTLAFSWILGETFGKKREPKGAHLHTIDNVNSVGVPQLILGIDPDAENSIAALSDALFAHEAVLQSSVARSSVRWLKPNLSFFLRQGSPGIALLEEFVGRMRPHYQILLDAKFSEIENSLRGSLGFAFKTLGAQAVTLNPFLGERSVRLALEACAESWGAQGRVFVLCRTSEASKGPLAHLQADWRAVVSCVANESLRLAQQDPQLAKIGGLVVGAGEETVLLSPELARSGLSVLAPGLGAQGASPGIIAACARAGLSEVLFPMSRGIFGGGKFDSAQSLARLGEALALFPTIVPRKVSGDSF
jgi:orotidine-5'-phosphate decarboxylase